MTKHDQRGGVGAAGTPEGAARVEDIVPTTPAPGESRFPRPYTRRLDHTVLWLPVASGLVAAIGGVLHSQRILVGVSASLLLGGASVLPLCLGVAACHWIGRSARARRRREGLPRFEVDVEWPELGWERPPIGYQSQRRATRAALGFAVLLSALSPFLVPLAPRGARAPWGMAAAVAIAATAGLVWLRRSSAPELRLTFAQRPYLTGAPITLRVGLTEDGSAVQQMDIMLGCAGQDGQADRRRWRSDLLWSVGLSLHRPDLVPAPGSDVDVTFHPPPGLPGSNYTARIPTVWLLHVVAHTDSLKLTYLLSVPVYDLSETEPFPEAAPA